MNIQQAIAAMLERKDLSQQDMQAVMRSIMTGDATPAQIGGFLIGLRMKGETVDEIAAAASVMRELSAGVQVVGEHVVDIVGTGGDKTNTFNISTASCFVVAAAGGTVAKHGNRSVSSKSGSADVLEAAGVNLDITPEQVGECINKIGVGFMFAPRHHSAMKYAIGPRKEMAVRTIFNLLGPLTNPAAVPRQVIGVYSKAWVEPLAKVLQQLGSTHVMVVHAEDGMDEISISAATYVAELKDGKVDTYTLSPDLFGIEQAEISDITVQDAQQSLAIVNDVLGNKVGAARDIVALNAGAAIYVAGLVKNMEAGVAKALSVLADGSAKQKLDALVKMSNSFTS